MNCEEIQRIFELEADYEALRSERENRERQYRQALYQQRQCSEQLSNYGGFSLKSMGDRLRGRYEQQLEQHRRQLRDAEMHLLQARQELERIKQKEKSNQQLRQTLAQWEALPEQVAEDSAALAQYSRLDRELCAIRLLPWLEKTLQGLQSSQQVYRGDTMGQIMTVQQRQEALAAADAPALQCRTLLLRMQKADPRVLIPDYFRDPVGFLANATKFNRYDRYAGAIAQTEALIWAIRDQHNKTEGEM